MVKKLAGYFSLSLCSFVLFTAVFHTAVNAQAIELPLLPSPTPKPQSVIPTPTTFFTVTIPSQSIIITTPTPTPQEENINEQQTQTETSSQTDKIVKIPSPTSIPTSVPIAIPTAIPQPTATPEPLPDVAAPVELEPFFAKYAGEYSVDANLLKRIARCETGFNSQSDTGTYAGMYQFLASTWSSIRGRMGMDQSPDLRKNAEESIRTAAFMIANGQKSAWPNCH
ncbi:MAG: transglycosylase family protein [Patescibacteria group bacterium]